MESAGKLSIRALPLEQTPQAAALLSGAFHDYPVFVSAVPQAEIRTALLPSLFERTVRYSLRFGHVDTTAVGDGVACWLGPGQTELSLWRMLRHGFLTMAARFGWSAYRRFRLGQEATERLHRQHVPGPHWYLWALGVAPQQQHRGVGAALLAARLDALRGTRTTVYLETHHARNVPFYEKRGFRVAGEADVPAIGLHIWAMVRPPE